MYRYHCKTSSLVAGPGPGPRQGFCRGISGGEYTFNALPSPRRVWKTIGIRAYGLTGTTAGAQHQQWPDVENVPFTASFCIKHYCLLYGYRQK